MVNDSHGGAEALLDSPGPGTAGPARRPAPRRPNARPMAARQRAEVSHSDDTLIVRVPLCDGPVELRMPREAVHSKKRPPQQHIEGFNADATPC